MKTYLAFVRAPMAEAARRARSLWRRHWAPLLTCIAVSFPLVASDMHTGSATARDGTGAKSVKTPIKFDAMATPAGYIAHRDPTTGKFVNAPKGARELVAGMSASERRALSTSHQGLVMEKLASGADVVRLNGRFRYGMVASRDSDGRITIRCDVHEPCVTGEEQQ